MKLAYLFKTLLALIIVASIIIELIIIVKFDDVPIGITSLIILSIKLTVIANVYTFILIGDSMILGWFKRLVEQIANNYFGMTPKGIERKNWFLKPILYCEECIAGQFGLWGYLLTNIHNYSLLNHIFVIALCIGLTSKFKQFFL